MEQHPKVEGQKNSHRDSCRAVTLLCYVTVQCVEEGSLKGLITATANALYHLMSLFYQNVKSSPLVIIFTDCSCVSKQYFHEIHLIVCALLDISLYIQSKCIYTLDSRECAPHTNSTTSFTLQFCHQEFTPLPVFSFIQEHIISVLAIDSTHSVLYKYY